MLPALSAPASVWFDDQLTPHIKAANDHDLYFLQGYVHAWFRLWQMDMQTRAAAGRVSEVAGDKSVVFDRRQRRKGMVYAAERSLEAVNANPQTRDMVAAYTAGINAYIGMQQAVTVLLLDVVPGEIRDRIILIVFRECVDDVARQDRKVPHAHAVLRVGKAGGVAEGGAEQADFLRLGVHLVGERVTGEGEQEQHGQAHTRSIGRRT